MCPCDIIDATLHLSPSIRGDRAASGLQLLNYSSEGDGFRHMLFPWELHHGARPSVRVMLVRCQGNDHESQALLIGNWKFFLFLFTTRYHGFQIRLRIWRRAGSLCGVKLTMVSEEPRSGWLPTHAVPRVRHSNFDANAFWLTGEYR